MTLPVLRWDVWTTAQEHRSRVVSAMQARFPNLGAHLIEDLFDEVCETAARPPGEPNCWPGDAPLEGFLRWRLERRLLNHLERRTSRHANLEDLEPALVTESADPALIVAARDESAIYARHLAELSEDAQRYIADLQAGLKRAEIVEATGWGPKKIKLLRKRIQEAVILARNAAAAVVLPMPVGRLWRKLGQTAGDPSKFARLDTSIRCLGTTKAGVSLVVIAATATATGAVAHSSGHDDERVTHVRPITNFAPTAAVDGVHRHQTIFHVIARGAPPSRTKKTTTHLRVERERRTAHRKHDLLATAPVTPARVTATVSQPAPDQVPLTETATQSSPAATPRSVPPTHAAPVTNEAAEFALP